MSEEDLANEKVSEILLELEVSKRAELEKVISENYSEDSFFVKNSRENRIKKLKKQLAEEEKLIETMKAELADKEKERQQLAKKLRKVNNIDKLDSLPQVEDLKVEETEFATEEARQKLANKFEFLAEKIRESDFLSQGTIDTFDFYRNQLISRCLKEEEYWEKLKNL
jgi:uncharacterized coiled-coil protein SlyX